MRGDIYIYIYIWGGGGREGRRERQRHGGRKRYIYGERNFRQREKRKKE